MSRLIDADKLISFIDPGHLRSPNERCLSENDVVKMINAQPTAYDVDKVVEQLEDMRAKPIELVYDVPFLREIIEIVRKGGAE